MSMSTIKVEVLNVVRIDDKRDVISMLRLLIGRENKGMNRHFTAMIDFGV